MRRPISCDEKLEPRITQQRQRKVARRIATAKPVLIMKLSLGKLSRFSWSDSSDLTGSDRMIKKTMTGRRMATQMQMLGEDEQSLNRHITVPKTTKTIMATVPLPRP